MIIAETNRENQFNVFGEIVSNTQILDWAVSLALQYMGKPVTLTQTTYLSSEEWIFLSDVAMNLMTPQLNVQYGTNLVITQAMIDTNLIARKYIKGINTTPTATNNEVLNWAVDWGLQNRSLPLLVTIRTELTDYQWEGISSNAINAVPSMNEKYGTNLVITQEMINDNLNARNYYKMTTAPQPTATNSQVLGLAIDIGLQQIIKPPESQSKTNLTIQQWDEVCRVVFAVVPQLNLQYNTNLVVTQAMINDNLHARNYWLVTLAAITITELVMWAVDAGLSWINKPSEAQVKTELTTQQWDTVSHVAFDTAYDLNLQYGTNLIITQSLIDANLTSRNYVHVSVEEPPISEITNEDILGWAVDAGLSWFNYSRIATSRTEIAVELWKRISDITSSKVSQLNEQNGTNLVITQKKIDDTLNARNYFETLPVVPVPKKDVKIFLIGGIIIGLYLLTA